MNQPLRYEIISWSQVPQCQSNASKLLHLRYVRVSDKSLSGELIRVEHERFGCLFSYLVSGSGSLLMESKNGQYHEFSNEEILKELEKYGFYIQFALPYSITGEQIDLLMTVQGLGMDKIRFISILPSNPRIGQEDPSQEKLVAFKIRNNYRWLDNTYKCTEQEFSKMSMDGLVVNMSLLSSPIKENWEFLRNKVLDIPSILEEIDIVGYEEIEFEVLK